MTGVRFKDLCIDARRPEPVARFWADVLGLTAAPQEGGDWYLSGATPEETIWVNTVEDDLGTKSRVHLDVRFPDGVLPDAPVVAEHPHWTVMTDPDGLELCAFGPRGDAPRGAFELVVDSADPLAIATWWATQTGARLEQRPDVPWVWLEDVPGLPWPFWVFNPVPEAKTVKNRVHWDVTGDLQGLLADGATVVGKMPRWTVLADPEGNEFCCFPPR